MEILIGLLIIAVGAFCQSSSYVPINKVKGWSWESYWLVQGVFAWLLFPLLGALLAVPAGHSLFELFTPDNQFNVLMTMLFGVLWGVGGLTFGLSMRYLGVALGQSIALGTCAAGGTVLGPVLLNAFFPEMGALSSLTFAVISGVVVTLLGIAIIGIAGMMKANSLPEEQKKAAVKDFNFPKGIVIALLAGVMSGCFNVGLEFGKDINFGALTPDIFKTLPATLLVTLGGFVTNAVYCLYQNFKNRTFGDYAKGSLWLNNALFCALAGALWYSQFFGLSLGKGFLTESPTLMTLSFCVLMALNVTFANVWGIILKEWKGCSKKTIAVLVLGLCILVLSSFLPELLK
ncbi:MAG: rhamnose/proton symporter RhaT [Alistipes sp.]|nr:rhamnose/proton symporter RhaT [Alistipes sp.]